MDIKKIKLAIIDYLIPPGLWRWHVNRNRKYGIMRSYASWEDASRAASGYDSPAIIEKVTEVALKVKNGEKPYSRDGTAYDSIRHSWHLLAALLWAASRNENRLKVLDFGGALGTSYFQNRAFLSHLEDLRWDIVEQQKIYEIGKRMFQEGSLRFYSSVADYSLINTPDVALLSSSMQYIRESYRVLDEIIALNPRWIIFDKTPFLDKQYDTPTRQRVSPRIYPASYPCWIFGNKKFLSHLQRRGYRLVEKIFENQNDMYQIDGTPVQWKGYLFEKQGSESVQVQPPAPVALFAYNRPDHLRRTIDALKDNGLAQESELFVFSDGAKGPEDMAAVRAVREFIHGISGFKNVHVTERDQNIGLARNIMEGVTDIVDRFGTVIVLEDDMVTSPYFLRYMNDALEAYRDNEDVISIHGYTYPTRKTLPETFFLRGADCWGWATWKRGWDLLEPDGAKLLAELERRNLTHEFDFAGSYGYTDMLRGQIVGKNDSWAIRWYASAFLNGKFTLYPGNSLVKNIGMDGTGKHSGTSRKFDAVLSQNPIEIRRMPVRENDDARLAFAGFFRSLRPHVLQRVLSKLRRIWRWIVYGTRTRQVPLV